MTLKEALDHAIDLGRLLPVLGGPLQEPHPLAYLGQDYLDTLHRQFLDQFISGALYLPLWMYCSTHGIKPSTINPKEDSPWFPLFQLFHSIPRQPNDKSLMVKASLMAAESILGQSGELMSPEVMMTKGQVLAAAGTLAYLGEGNMDLNHSVVERYLSKYPRLMNALMPEGYELSGKHITTVYHLLLGNAGFNIRRLFGWHSTNTFAGEDSPKVMPHFSEGELACHSRHAKLSFPYYLKHGRPAFTFLSFLAEELDRRDASLSQKRLQQACGAALWIACQHFDVPPVSSACVVFVELLGQDSLLVRSLVQTGRMLLTHRHRQVTGGAEARKEQLKNVVAEIVSVLQRCVRSHHRHGNKLITMLEEATAAEIQLEGLDNCSYEASLKWTPVLVLCQLLSLPLSPAFLHACAKADHWLMFIYFAQLHQFPTHQLQSLLHSFSSSHLRDHLQYVLANADSKLFSTQQSVSPTSSVASTQSSSAGGERRSSLNQRMPHLFGGRPPLHKSAIGESVHSSSSEEDSRPAGLIVSSFTSRFKQAEFSECELPDSSLPDDVFRLLFHSSSMPSQWRCLLSAAMALRNPLFAELAACCGCPAIPSLCGWLLSCVSDTLKQEVLDRHSSPVSRWGQEQLQDLITTLLRHDGEDILAVAFAILQPESPLLPFFKFLNEFVTHKNLSACKEQIDLFKDAMAVFDIRRPPSSSETDLATIGDRPWLEEVAYQALCHQLGTVGSVGEAWHLLRLLDHTNMCLVFSFDVLNFASLHKVVSILHEHNIPGLSLLGLLTSGLTSDLFADQCQTALDFLIGQKKFGPAQELVAFMGTGGERLVVCQLKSEKEELEKFGLWSAKSVRIQYWEKCQLALAKAECSPQTCAQIFKGEIESTSVEQEKSVLCHHWLSLIETCEDEHVVRQRETVLRDMWRHRIAAKLTFEVLDPLDLIFDDIRTQEAWHGDLKSDLLKASQVLGCVSDSHEDLSAQELETLDDLMGTYLDRGLVSACTQVAAVFGHYNQDLAIIQTCNAIARGQKSYENIEPAMKRLVAKVSTQKRLSLSTSRLNRSFSISSVSSASSGGEPEEVSANVEETITVLERLLSHCVKGRQLCLRIITCFKISEILGQDYEEVVLAPEFDSLRALLKASHPAKFSLARDFLSTSSLSDSEVTVFLADSIVDVLKVFVKGHKDSDSELYMDVSSSTELMFNPADGMEVFGQLMKLCGNTAMLGDRILQSVAALASESKTPSPAVLTIQTELLIMAHECHTMSSNMEGISHILRAARVCSDCLAEAGEFTLMIRLLTGVGRYSEMLYIFHTLQQQHQFELLLRKGMDREDKLKVAILDYLKRYQPEDSEAYTMVALKFSMYRDIASMLEALGHKTMKLFKNLDAVKDAPETLRKCCQYFQDAAESYVKDNSVRKAQRCVKLARLLTLQLQLLPSGVWVIHLSRNEVTEFINTHTRFIEAMVVSDAYERRPDWTEAIYNNVLVAGELRYLQELKLHVHITTTLIEDVVRKFKQAPVKPSGGLTAIRKLLSHCKDLQLQYRLASELGLTDVVTSMLKGDSGCYLQDISMY